ncbi:MAG: GNAT family N-acetyltransferase [Promethearchaeota archaeon]
MSELGYFHQINTRLLEWSIESRDHVMIKILKAHYGENLKLVRELLVEYVQSLGFNLDFQDFEKELEEFPGEYIPPNGGLLLALYDNQLAGCVALRKFNEGICEMKRLYVRPAFRGKGIGKALANTIIRDATENGYKSIRLDTIPTMKAAISLYHSLGFKVIAPYRYNPIKGSKFMELILK